MITTIETFEGWLVKGTKEMASVIFFERMNTATLQFLLARKLVTKTFGGINFVERGSQSIPNESRKTYKIILVNIRKKLPLIKMGDAAYHVPFIQFYTRAPCLYLYISGGEQGRLVLERYFRYIKMREFFNNNGIPIRCELANDDRMIDDTRTVCTQIKFYTRPSEQSFSLYSIIFLIPKIIQLSTLHRKAHFKNDDSAAICTTTLSDTINTGNGEPVNQLNRIDIDF
jgi:hypothetical protein